MEIEVKEKNKDLKTNFMSLKCGECFCLESTPNTIFIKSSSFSFVKSSSTTNCILINATCLVDGTLFFIKSDEVVVKAKAKIIWEK